MSSPTSLTHRYLSPLKALWKIRCTCLTSLAIDRCAFWSTYLQSAIFQVSWEIQDTRTFVGRGVIGTSPLITLKAAYPLV